MSIGARQFIYMLLMIPAIMLATTVHEATRALISTLLGDDTPKREGRLTINPINHFEPIGFLLLYSTGMAGVGVGWGKPVNTNSRHYANRRTGAVLTAVWPSVANLLVAIGLNYALKYAPGITGLFADFLALSIRFNVFLITCNLLPVAPFDCIKVVIEYVSRKNYFAISQSESVMQLILILLLFSGLLSFVLNPVYSVFMTIVTLLTF